MGYAFSELFLLAALVSHQDGQISVVHDDVRVGTIRECAGVPIHGDQWTCCGTVFDSWKHDESLLHRTHVHAA